MSKHFLGLIVRCKDELYIKEFCDYYISQGIDKIHILDDFSENKDIFKNITSNKVQIFYENFQCGRSCILNKGFFENLKSTNKLYNSIKKDFEWLIMCDADEFITTRKNIDNTIRDELKTTFKECDCIRIPWVMMAFNGLEKNPKSILETNIYRMNNDIKHLTGNNGHKVSCRFNGIAIKSIFKPAKFLNVRLGEHTPQYSLVRLDEYNIVNGINNKLNKVNAGRNMILRENNIENGYLLCYHYRFVSIEHCKHKIKTSLIYNSENIRSHHQKNPGYTLEECIDSDYPEIIDETLKNKSLKYKLQ